MKLDIFQSFWSSWRRLPSTQKLPAYVKLVEQLERGVAGGEISLRQAGTALLPSWEVGAKGLTGDFEVVSGLAEDLSVSSYEADGAAVDWKQILQILEKYQSRLN